MFLMETAGIDNTIINSTALVFILNIDELIFETVTTVQTRHMMSEVLAYTVPKPPDQSRDVRDSEETEENLIERSGAKRWTMNMFPRKLSLCTVLWLVLLVSYYFGSCQPSPDGTLVSQPMYAPISTDYSHFSALFPFLFPVEHQEDPYWTMPPEHDAPDGPPR